MDINPLSDVSVNMSSHSVGCLFILLMLFLCCEKTFHFEIVPFIYFFSFVSLAWGDISDKILLWAMSKTLLPMFSPMILMVSGLTFQSLIHFEFILVCGVRRWSSFIFLHVSVQFSQHHLLNKLSLAHCFC